MGNSKSIREIDFFLHYLFLSEVVIARVRQFELVYALCCILDFGALPARCCPLDLTSLPIGTVRSGEGTSLEVPCAYSYQSGLASMVGLLVKR